MCLKLILIFLSFNFRKLRYLQSEAGANEAEYYWKFPFDSDVFGADLVFVAFVRLENEIFSILPFVYHMKPDQSV